MAGRRSTLAWIYTDSEFPATAPSTFGMHDDPATTSDTILHRGRGREASDDDFLPPVEPPSAGFLVQLFLVPAVIVAIIVAVWLSFHWLAHLGSDPQALVRTLRRDNEGRWQAALNLANDLRGPGGGPLKADETLARDLGKVLDDEVTSGRTGEQTQTLRIYLCRALGEFTTPVAAPPLVRIASGDGDPQVVRAAVEGLALLASNVRTALGPAVGGDDALTTQMRDAVLAASRSQDAAVRGSAAFALGVIGGEPAVDRLLELVVSGENDAKSSDVRFNAATSLARLGRSEAFEPLEEMLSLPDEPAPDTSLRPEVAAAMQSKRYKRAMVVVNALRGVASLMDAGVKEVPESVVRLVESLAKDPVAEVRSSAAAIATKLRRSLPGLETPDAVR